MDPTAEKQEIRRYLLGALDDDGKTSFEERILSVPEAYDELSIIEDELINDYAAGGLSELERQQFESHFLITAERQKNLRFAQLLTRYVNAHPVPVAQDNFTAAAALPHVDKVAPAKKSVTLSLLPSTSLPGLVFCVAGVVLLGITLVSWFVLRRPPLLSKVQPRSEPVVVVTLTPESSTTRDTTARRVNVPPKGYNVKLELELANASFRNYKSELFRENKSLQTRDELKIESNGKQYVVPLTITGEILRPGDYEVKLSGVLESGADEFVEKYSFRVIE